MVLGRLREYGIDAESARKHIESNKHNNITTTYYLLMTKLKQQHGGEAFSPAAAVLERVSL